MNAAFAMETGLLVIVAAKITLLGIVIVRGNVLDAIGVCGGDCTADVDSDGVCDDVDPCVGDLDACGVCNGPGAVYGCGCEELVAGTCDCDGNVEDALGVCGGNCPSDDDDNGICDNLEGSGLWR